MREIQLTPREAELYAIAGVQRKIAHRVARWPERYGCGERDPAGYSSAVQGTHGEWHVAQNLGLWCPGGRDEDGNGDLPGNIGVRTRTHHAYELFVHADDPDDRRFVLVTGVWPRLHIRGWMYGGEAKQGRYWNAQLPVAAYTPPHSALRRIDDLDV